MTRGGEWAHTHATLSRAEPRVAFPPLLYRMAAAYSLSVSRSRKLLTSLNPDVFHWYSVTLKLCSCQVPVSPFPHALLRTRAHALSLNAPCLNLPPVRPSARLNMPTCARPASLVPTSPPPS